MKKKKGAPVKSRAVPRRSASQRGVAAKKPPAGAARTAVRIKSRETPRTGQGHAARRDLYPALEPFRHGYLRVSDVHEIYYEECGNPAG